MAKGFAEGLKKVPLRIRLKVSIQAHCLAEMGGHIFMDADETSEQHKEQVKTNAEIMKFAKPLIDNILEDVDGWEKDGCP